MDRIEVKKKRGRVCDVCAYFGGCENSDELYEVGCESFELETYVECNIDCEECHLYVLEICKGWDNKNEHWRSSSCFNGGGENGLQEL